ncbi:hypothetical protein CC78DRAFT_267118 [Lojkania enalia]|uniref:Uncharacterized protein n=1 Tax=Lojkania enalia TaxID=147567 RepID=A0A9P4K6L7_9PLEO|nr:hypothetical protein CC78DRAFT_267118 [Didymosphaeria enalia]
MADLSEQKIISTFDQLVAEGVIIYGPNEKIEIDCDGYPLEFRICPSLLRKPFLPGALLDSSFNRSRKFGPGSDLYLPHPSLLITTLNNTHSLALNLFCVDRPQYICVTVDSYMRQDEVLNVDDFYAALEMLNSLQDVVEDPISVLLSPFHEGLWQDGWGRDSEGV